MAIKKYTPGLLLLIVISYTATLIAGLLPSYVGNVIVAIILGLIINNSFKLKTEVFGPGIKLGLNRFLKLGIIFLGAGISFNEIINLGLKGLFVIIILITAVFVLTFSLGSKLNVSLKKKILIAMGACICGNTAILTVAPIIDAEEEEVAMAVGIVTLFGVLAVFIYPLIGIALQMSDGLFGAWAGTAINDTSQVVAAGFLYSEAAGKIATTIKLTRNIMIVPVVLLIAYIYRRGKNSTQSVELDFKKVFPTFILGFLFFVCLKSVGLLTPEISGFLTKLSKLLILLALSGIGLGVDFSKFKQIGARPFILGFVVEAFMAVIAYLLNYLVFG